MEAGSFGVLVKLDKHGLIQLAKSLAQGTLQVLDNFCCENKNNDFLSRPVVGEDVKLLEYLDQIPPWVEDEPVEKCLVPLLHPLCLSTHPEISAIEKRKSIGKNDRKASS